MNESEACGEFALFRPLLKSERNKLVQNGNYAQSWDLVRVSEGFDPGFVQNCRFFGDIAIGALKEGFLNKNGLTLPFGLYDSTFFNCSMGHFVAINKLFYCSRCFIGNEVIIHNVGEIINSQSARFGNGAIADNGYGEADHRVINLINENGGRAVIPFDGMLCTDAFIWARFRDDTQLMNKLTHITDSTCSENTGCKGLIGDGSIVRNVRSIRDTSIGNGASIDGAEVLENSTVRSDDLEPSFLGPGSQLRDSLVGYGNKIDSGAQLKSVLTSNRVTISRGARIDHSFIGDNSSIACCEVANSLIFPSHGQHHNNSFLIASLIGGQSNIAANSTIGSNHNSRSSDGEIWASRGFWPGLCTSFKHNSFFASYTMCSKADYPYELDIPYPFSLISNDPSQNRLIVYPAYWFTRNIYALMMNRLKFSKRDQRIHRGQHIEHDPLAPDTIEEIFTALNLLQRAAGQIWYDKQNLSASSDSEIDQKGESLLAENSGFQKDLIISKHSMEKSNRVVLLKNVIEAFIIYREMIRWYAVKTIIQYPGVGYSDFKKLIPSKRDKEWINCGGQIWRKHDLLSAINNIKSNQKIETWDHIHHLYDEYQELYNELKFKHALGCLAALEGISPGQFTAEHLRSALERAIPVCKKVAELTHASRHKDFTGHFRRMIYQSDKEMQSVLGSTDDDLVLQEISQESEALIESIEKLVKILG